MQLIKVRQHGQDHYLPFQNIHTFQDDGSKIMITLKASAIKSGTRSFVFEEQEADHFREWLRNHSSDVLMGVLR